MDNKSVRAALVAAPYNKTEKGQPQGIAPTYNRLNLDFFDFPDEQDARNQANQINHKNQSADL